MQLIFDNLTATLIATTIFLMLITVHSRNQQAQVQAAGFYALRNQQINFIETLRRDMAGMVCIENDDGSTEKCPEFEEDSTYQTYAFHSRLGDAASPTRVIYKRRKVDERDGVDLYQIQRYEDASGSLLSTLLGNLDPDDYDGGSMSTITSWTIEAQGPEGEKIDPSEGGPLDIRQIYIRFETIPPFGTGDDMAPTPWEATYRPMYLRGSKTL